jgi:serine phosphatase RsbU (regulator of sigma subunit)
VVDKTRQAADHSRVRVRPYTLCAAVSAAAIAACSAGVASAAPLLPTVTVPTLQGAPPVVNDAVSSVNGVTGGVTDTVNDTVDTVGNVISNPGGAVNGVTPPSTPVTGSVPGVSKPNPDSSSSGGSGTGSTPSPSGRTSSPAATGGDSQTSRRPATRRNARRAAQRAARRAGGANPGARRPAASPAAAKRSRTAGAPAAKPEKHGNAVARVINRIDRVIPGPIKALIALLALAAAGFALHSRLALRRARRLERQREELLGDVGLLQRALLPEVPSNLRGIDVSVAYRPAEGPAAGGDFYDVFELEGGRTAIIVGDVCGHGRAALAVTALMRYTLRAYAAAGFEPRVALQVAGRALDGDPEGALTTVVLAVYDPAAGTLTYACAGHEPPIVLGPAAYDPVTAFSSPPLGGLMETGQRQTTVPLPPGSSVCFFTDGLVEARLGDDMIGRGRLSELLGQLEPDSGAQLLLERLAASADRAPDDMAACLVRASGDAMSAAPVRVEELEVDAAELDSGRVDEFLAACGIAAPTATDTVRLARAKAAEFGGAMVRVEIQGPERRVDVAPRETASLPVPSLDAARRRAALEVPSL